jgi:hypothetical protein
MLATDHHQDSSMTPLVAALLPALACVTRMRMG